MDQLLEMAGRMLDMDATHVYDEDGSALLSTDVVQNNDVLYISNGERTRGPAKRVFSVVSQRHDDTDPISDLCSASDDGSIITTQTAVVVSSQIPVDPPIHPPPPSMGPSDPGSSAPPPESDWVTLNVGGQVFHTSRTTLCRDADSMLARLFGRGFAPSDEPGTTGFRWKSTTDASGAVLFDRDPRYFSPVLNYLRTSVLILPEDVSLEGLLLEAQFFQIARLQEDILSELEAREARANNIHKKRYVVLTVKGDGIKLIEGPVDDVMRNLNGGIVPPRKPPFSVESDDLHTRVYGLTELGWLLKNFKLSEVLDALRDEDWVLIQSSAAYSSCNIGPGNLSSKTDEDTEHLFIFAHISSQIDMPTH